MLAEAAEPTQQADSPIQSASTPAPAAATTLPTGRYDFEWKGGTFEVELRAGGIFWCSQFPAAARWSFDAGTLEIDWDRFGQYVLQLEGDELVGSVKGREASWRRARFKRAFTPQEELLSGSAWMLHGKAGAPFRVEFHADGRFVCPTHPGSTLGGCSYTLSGDAVAVEWGKFGSYEFRLDASTREMAGSSRQDPASPRRLEYVEALPAFVPPQTCKKGCCEGNVECGRPGRKRGIFRPEDESMAQQAFALAAICDPRGQSVLTSPEHQ